MLAAAESTWAYTGVPAVSGQETWLYSDVVDTTHGQCDRVAGLYVGGDTPHQAFVGKVRPDLVNGGGSSTRVDVHVHPKVILNRRIALVRDNHLHIVCGYDGALNNKVRRMMNLLRSVAAGQEIPKA